MQIIILDRQSIFIHGMKISLQQRIPGVSIQGVSQVDELWHKLEENPDALLMLDGNLGDELCRGVVQKTAQQFPHVKIVLIVGHGGQKWVRESILPNILTMVPRDAEAETFVQALPVSSGNGNVHPETLSHCLDVKNRTQLSILRLHS